MVRRSRRSRALRPFTPGYGVGRLAQSFRRLAVFSRNRMGGSRSRTLTRTRGGALSGIGVTTQRDSRHVYSKRRMPRFKRNRWKSFTRKVHAVAEKDMGSRTVVRNLQYLGANNTPGNHVVLSAYLYPQRGTAGILADDLNIIGGLENTGDQTAAAGETVAASSKILFQSGIMDITIKNDSAFRDSLNAAILIPDSRLKMEVDVYEISVRPHTEETGTTFVALEGLLGDNATQTTSIGGGGLELNYLQRGVTPWDLTYTLSRWGVKIWKKTKYMIPNGDCITYQVRDPKRRVATYREIGQADGFNRTGWTRCVLMIAKTVPGTWVIGTGVNEVTERLLVGCTKKYFYKIEGMSEDRTRYV